MVISDSLICNSFPLHNIVLEMLPPDSYIRHLLFLTNDAAIVSVASPAQIIKLSHAILD